MVVFAQYYYYFFNMVVLKESSDKVNQILGHYLI